MIGQTRKSIPEPVGTLISSISLARISAVLEVDSI